MCVDVCVCSKGFPKLGLKLDWIGRIEHKYTRVPFFRDSSVVMLLLMIVTMVYGIGSFQQPFDLHVGGMF